MLLLVVRNKIVFVVPGYAKTFENQLLKRYLIKREKQGIDLVPVYDRTIFISSDAANDSFEEGKGFHNITQMSDSVLVVVNRVDGPLTMSQYMNMKLRMGRDGPTNMEQLPGSVQVWDITGLISWADMPAIGYDYLLRNKAMRDTLINRGLDDSFEHGFVLKVELN